MQDIIRNIKGTKDILPNESYIWVYMENYIHHHFSKFGYKEIRTPSFENTDLFLRSIGQETDIVSKEMYSWKDQGDNNLTLRPELTASVVRSYIQHQLGKQNKLHKLYYLGSSYRRERPQKGRFRQFKQFGLEAFGSSFPEQDAEIIYMAYSLYDALGIKSLELKINSIGSRDSRKKYKEALQHYFIKFEDKLTDTSKKRLKTNPLRLLDTKIDFEIELIKDAPKIIDYLDEEDSEHLKKVLSLLDDMNVPYTLDYHLVRGLDYYSRTVFEIQTNTLGSQNALCGGGRYDKLVEYLGGKPIPAVGFAAGLERLMLILNENSDDSKDIIDIYIISTDQKSTSSSLIIADKIRNTHGIKVVCETLRRSMKSQLREANKLNAQFVIIIGEEEISSGEVIIKNMQDSSQISAPIDNIENYFGVNYEYK